MVRSRWVGWTSAVLFVFSAAISYFGLIYRGQMGFQGFGLTIASLMGLSTFLIPLIGLMMGHNAIAGEREAGSLDLLLSLPVPAGAVILGKFIGLAQALGMAIAVGFGATAALVVLFAGPGGLAQYVFFLASSYLLGLAYLSIALLISTWSQQKTAATAASVGVWFFSAIVFDLLILGVLVGLGQRATPTLVATSFMLNPADVFRFLNVTLPGQIGELASLAGPVSLSGAGTASFPLLLGALLAWIALPLAAAVRVMKRQDC